MKPTVLLICCLLTAFARGAENIPVAIRELVSAAASKHRETVDGRSRLQLTYLSLADGGIESFGRPVTKEMFLGAADLVISCNSATGHSHLLKILDALPKSSWKIQGTKPQESGLPRAYFQLVGPSNAVELEFLIDPAKNLVSSDVGRSWYRVDENLIKAMTTDFVAFVNSKFAYKTPAEQYSAGQKK